MRLLLVLSACTDPSPKHTDTSAEDTANEDTTADTDTADSDTAPDTASDTSDTATDPPTLTLGRSVAPMAVYTALGSDEATTRALVASASGVGTLIPSLGGTTVWWNTDEAEQDATYAAALAGGTDLLQVFVEAAHAAGQTVTPSVAIYPSEPLYALDPEWITRDRTGAPHSNYALAFSNPDARAAKMGMLLDLACGYDVDGLFLDYTRYPDDDWGFDTPLLEACAAEGFDPRVVDTDSDEFARFRVLRAASVTAFVTELREAALACNPDLRMGGFGGPDPEPDAAYYGRDYPAWAQAGAVDDIYLATYDGDVGGMRQIIATNRAAVGDGVRLLGTLPVYEAALATEDELIRATREQAVGGVDGLWVYRQDWVEDLGLWDGVAAAQAKLERLLAPESRWTSGWDARRDGAPSEVGWAASGGPMTLDGEEVVQDAASGFWMSPLDTALSDGTLDYALVLRGWPDSDLGTEDPAAIALGWSDGARTLRVGLDLADAGGGDGALVLPGDGTVVASWSAADGLRPDEVEPAWAASGSAGDGSVVSVSDGALRFGYAADADPENGGDYGGYTSPEATLLDMSVGGPGYRIDATLRPADDLASTGYAYEHANITLWWGDDEGVQALTFDADGDDSGAGTTGSVSATGYPMTPLIAGIDWSVAHALSITYDGVADTFVLDVDGVEAAVIARSDLAGAWSADMEGRLFFGDTTTGGLAPDYDSEWAEVEIQALGVSGVGSIAWSDEPEVVLVHHADDDVVYVYVEGKLADWVDASQLAVDTDADLAGRVAFGNFGEGGHTARWQRAEVFELEP